MPFFCITCKKEIPRHSPSVSVCSHCARAYVLQDDTIDFYPDDHSYWGEISLDEMTLLLQTSRDVGYKKACIDFFSSHPTRKDLMAYILNTRERINFLRPVFAANTAHTCLDIGSGLGAIPAALCKKFEQVYSIELVKERVEFQKIRREQDNLHNWHIIKSDIYTLPFPDNFFDFISINGVLEWIPVTNFNGTPQEIQESFLKEVKRVLKPSGVCYIGIENRFGHLYFKGALDHNGLRFTSIIPRFLANLVSYIQHTYKQHNFYYDTNGKVPFLHRYYRTYTHSKKGYLKLLRNIGITNAALYHTGHTYDYANPIINDAALPIIHTCKQIIAKWLPYFKYAYTPVISSILGNVSQNFLIYFRKDNKTITSDLMDIAHSNGIQKNFVIYNGFNNILLLDVTTKKMYRSDVHTLQFVEESIVPGTRPTAVTPQLFRSVIQNTKKHFYTNIVANPNALLVIKERMLALITQYKLSDALSKKIERVYTTHSSSRLFATTHGDLWLGNILIDDAHQINFIDQEHNNNNIVVTDILRFLMSFTSYAIAPHTNPHAEAYLRILEEEFPGLITRDIIADFYPIALLQELERYDFKHGTPRTELLDFYNILKHYV